MKKAAEQGVHGEKTDETERKSPSSGEFLSGFWKEDRLIPSITVTIYFGSDDWDGPLSLLEMMEIEEPEVVRCMDNYHVRLIAPAQMTEEEIGKFQSSLREVLLFIKYSKDKKNLEGVLKRNEKRFRELERRAADVIQVITHTDLKYEEKEGSVDVCQAIQEMREEERLKGEKAGEVRGAKRAEKILNELMKRLIQDKRMEDLKRAVYDGDYKEQLLMEYGIRRKV